MVTTWKTIYGIALLECCKKGPKIRNPQHDTRHFAAFSSIAI